MICERKFCLGSNPVDYLEEHGEVWENVAIHLGQLGEADEGRGTRLGSLDKESLRFWIVNYTPEKYHGQWVEADVLLDAGLCVAEREMNTEGRVYANLTFR